MEGCAYVQQSLVAYVQQSLVAYALALYVRASMYNILLILSSYYYITNIGSQLASIFGQLECVKFLCRIFRIYYPATWITALSTHIE